MEFFETGNWENFEVLATNMDIEADYGVTSDGNEKHVIRNWGKGDPYYNMTKNLAVFSVFCER